MSVDSASVANLRHNLQHLMGELEMNQGQLAERAGISREYVNGILNGRHVPRLDIVEKLAKALGCSIGRLVREAKDLAAAT